MEEISEKKIHVEIVTPYELFYENDIQQLVLPAVDGEIGIWPGHTPVIIALHPGELRMVKNNHKSYVAVSDGYAHIDMDNAIVVVGSAEWPEQIDEERVQKALDRALQRISDPATSKQEIARSKRGLLRAKTRLKVATKKSDVLPDEVCSTGKVYSEDLD